MKKIASLFIMTVLILSSISLSAQKKAKPFTGLVTITISFDGTWDAATLAQQPKTMLMTLSQTKAKTEILAGGASLITITNTIDSSQIVLINAMGTKIYVKSTKEELLADLGEEDLPKINYVDETKSICGYDAKKAEYITIDEYGDEVITVVYYTDKIGTPSMNFAGQFHGLNGFPLEYTVTTEEGKITYTVTELKAKKIKDTEFLIPTDYEEYTREQLKGLFGG